MTATLTTLPSTTRLAAALVAATFLTACGGGGSSGNTTVTTTTTTTLPNTTVGSVSPANYAASTPQRDAYDYLNSQRQLCGFGLLQQDVMLDLAAQGHAAYLGLNNLVGHYQDKTQAPNGFTGVGPGDRLTVAGYAFSSWSEVATTGTDGYAPGQNLGNFGSNFGKAAILNFFTGPYHGYGLLTGQRDVGVGYDGTGTGRLIIDMATSSSSAKQKLGTSDVATLPCNGVSGVLAQSYGYESPTPIAGRSIAATSAPIGTPIYIKVRDGQKLTLTSTDLRAVGTNTSLALIALTKANDVNAIILDESMVMLMPNLPLAKNTSYLFTATGTNNAAPVSVSFTFSTGAY